MILWAKSDQISWAAEQALENGNSLAILIEKDFFCLKPRTHQSEDESDLFHNPNEKQGRCG